MFINIEFLLDFHNFFSVQQVRSVGQWEQFKSEWHSEKYFTVTEIEKWNQSLGKNS